MLTLVHHLSGRPWAVRPEVAEYLRGMLAKDGVAGLRDLASLRAALMVSDDDDRPSARAEETRARDGATIAVIPVIGPLTQRGGFDAVACQGFRSTDSIAQEVRTAAAEPKVDAIVLEFDSPGGEVYGVPEAWAAIRDAAKAKPIVAAVNSVSASAAYYLASAASEIWVNPSGQVGSIGVYCVHVDVSKALERMGEQWTFVSAGKYKLEGNPVEPLGDEARAAIQAQVDSYYEDFVRDVARGRGVGASKVRNGFGEGRMMRAQAAVTEKMVDQVGTVDQALKRAAALARERRREGAGRAAAHAIGLTGGRTPEAGPVDVPNLTAGSGERSCANCEYYSQPSSASSGTCSLYDFTTDASWVCDSWEGVGSEEEAAELPVPAPPAPDAPIAQTLEQRQAVARLRSL